MVKVVIAEDLDIVRSGMRILLDKIEDVDVVSEVTNSAELIESINTQVPDVVFFNYTSDYFKLEDIPTIHSQFPTIKFIAITDIPDRSLLENALRSGISGHLLRCCDYQEIKDSIKDTMAGDRFFCGKVLNVIDNEAVNTRVASCAPLSLSERELEIIGLIAAGETNKQIADKLFLSTHTVNTHRKNIMAKLGINNTAGIVIYAVKEGLISPNRFLFSPQ